MSKYDIKDLYTNDVAAVITAADRSRNPLTLDTLFDLAAEYGVTAESLVLDVGCANGGNSRKLLARTGCTIEGVDYLQHLVEMGQAENRQARLEGRFKIQQGSIYEIPSADNHFDFVFCRDTLSLIDDLPKAAEECRRVLKPGKCMLVYTTLATKRMALEELQEFKDVLGCKSMDENRMDAVLAEKFKVERKIVLGSQGRQHMEESGDHDTTQNLLRISRLLTWKNDFVSEFGKKNYDIALADAKWGVYQMLGKLQPTIYVLSKD